MWAQGSADNRLNTFILLFSTTAVFSTVPFLHLSFQTITNPTSSSSIVQNGCFAPGFVRLMVSVASGSRLSQNHRISQAGRELRRIRESKHR